ncbi:MAG: DUF1992 domain-containing protein [Candidatus Desulfofervidus auxilii]|nr:DUF1992 domain-containing protein [Candidatus Desulfofervidus auxilii]
MWIFHKIAEKRIQEAMERGEFDNLEGKGKPLPREDDMEHVPPELRMAYKILKNAGCLPPELMLKKEIKELKDLLETMEDEKEIYLCCRRLNFLIMKLNMMRPTSPLLEEGQVYYKKIVYRMAKRRGKTSF